MTSTAERCDEIIDDLFLGERHVAEMALLSISEELVLNRDLVLDNISWSDDRLTAVISSTSSRLVFTLLVLRDRRMLSIEAKAGSERYLPTSGTLSDIDSYIAKVLADLR